MSQLLTKEEVLEAIFDGREVQYKHLDNVLWFNLTKEVVKDITFGRLFNGTFVFRLYRPTKRVDGIEFPKPVSKPLKEGTEYWVARPSYENYSLPNASRWQNDDLDKLYLRRGLIHLYREDAIAHAKALVKLSGDDTDD